MWHPLDSGLMSCHPHPETSGRRPTTNNYRALSLFLSTTEYNSTDFLFIPGFPKVKPKQKRSREKKEELSRASAFSPPWSMASKQKAATQPNSLSLYGVLNFVCLLFFERPIWFGCASGKTLGANSKCRINRIICQLEINGCGISVGVLKSSRRYSTNNKETISFIRMTCVIDRLFTPHSYYSWLNDWLVRLFFAHFLPLSLIHTLYGGLDERIFAIGTWLLKAEKRDESICWRHSRSTALYGESAENSCDAAVCAHLAARHQAKPTYLTIALFVCVWVLCVYIQRVGGLHRLVYIGIRFRPLFPSVRLRHFGNGFDAAIRTETRRADRLEPKHSIGRADAVHRHLA